MYRALVRLVRFALFVFFRQIVIVGGEHVPIDGPVLFAGNHPNSLIDPMLLFVAASRRMRLVAKDALFRSPILFGLGAVPIVRRVSGGRQRRSVLRDGCHTLRRRRHRDLSRRAEPCRAH